jgi:hypothetical protein
MLLLAPVVDPKIEGAVAGAPAVMLSCDCWGVGSGEEGCSIGDRIDAADLDLSPSSKLAL